jgi:hypothetical protein
MKTAGVVIDFYDDPTGRVLKQAYPDPESLPEQVKTAHILNTEERGVLRDEAYALILHNDGKVLRKFACVDAGNTLLSCLYFEENADQLPEEAIKVAAVNLERFCEEFGIKPPTLVKMAAATSASGKVRDSMRQPIVGDDADWAARTNLVSARGGADNGRVIPTANQMKTAGVEKDAGLINVYVVKSNGQPELAKVPSNVVDVSNKDPKHHVVKKASANTALDGRYSLDSFADVQKAVEYFEDNWTGMQPEDRHEFCVKTAARADQLGIEVSELMERYGSTDYSPDLAAQFASRKANCEEEYHELFDALFQKHAEIEPEVFAELLGKADEAAGLNWYYGGPIADPYYATFGGLSEKKAAADWSWENANGVSVNYEQLQSLVGTETLGQHFGKDFTSAFNSDPISIFESMPDTSKTIIARLAVGE